LSSITGKPVWSTSKSIGGRIITHDNILYHGTNGTASVRFYDIQTGSLLKNTRLPGAHSVDMISYSDNQILVHTDDAECFVLDNEGKILANFQETFKVFLKDGDVLYMESATGIQAVNSSTEEKFWGLETGFYSSIPVFSDKAFFLNTFSENGYILSVSRETGSINWKAIQNVLSNLYVTDDKIYFVSSDGYLVVLDKHSGKEILRNEFSPPFDLNKQSGKYVVTGDPANNVLVIAFGDNTQITGLMILNP
jgi:outer membrane protein assembly factor BamB